MQSTDARLKSFHHRTRSWPYSEDSYKANPGTLADAGFYWKPAMSSQDNVMCFLCGKSLDGWTDTDDPYDEHLSHSRTCGWAIVKSIPLVDDDELPFRWDDEDELPKGERMTKARIQTFGNWWPHENKGWYGTVKRMANAGFFYAPTDDSDDNVQCPYCWLGLDGWEANDDPVHEHQRRKPKCPFFATRVAAPTKASAAKATKSKRKNTGSVDSLPKNEQRAHTPIMDKPDPPKNARLSRLTKSSRSSSASTTIEENHATEAMNQSTVTQKSNSKKADIKSLSSSSSRSVEFNLPDTNIQESAKKPKAKAAPEKKPTPEEVNVLRRRSLRIKFEEIEESDRASQPLTQSTESEKSSKAGSRSSSTTGRKRQKQQQKESDDESTLTTVPNISVVVPKKQKLTKTGQALNHQNQNDKISLQDEGDKENISMDATSADLPTLENVDDNADSVSSTSKKSQQRPDRSVDGFEGDGELDQSSKNHEETQIENPQIITKPRGRPRKTLSNDEKRGPVVKSKRAAIRPLKRAPRAAELLTSPVKKKSPKALIEIFELPDEPEQEQKEQASVTTVTESKPEDSVPILDIPPEVNNTNDVATLEEPADITLATLKNNGYRTPEMAMTPPPPPFAPSTPPPKMESIEPTEGMRESTPSNDDNGFFGHPTTPVRRQAVSMQDIESAKVVVVNPMTPVRRAASSVDIEGWEDEDRRESTESRLSSPFISPSKWDLDGSSLSTSTPKSKKSPALPAPSISQKQKIKDMVGNLGSPVRHGYLNILHSPLLRPPLTKKTPRTELLSPEMKQQQLIDRLENLMQEDASSEVLAVAESALKEEVKLLRRSQNKERKTASAAAVVVEDEDVLMQESQMISNDKDNAIMMTPVKKHGMPVTFGTDAPTTPISHKTPLPISTVISAIGAASRRNHHVAASPFVNTPVKKTVDLLRLEDLEATKSPIHGDKSTNIVPLDLKSVNPFSGQGLIDPSPIVNGPDASAAYWERQRQIQMTRSGGVEDSQRTNFNSKTLRLHEDSKENERRLKLMKESGLSERELKMTVEEFHRVILEEQVRQLELVGEAWIQRFQEESDRVRRALLDDGAP
ncbi:hypothetical protein BGX20_011235 [Mortierella sp. AD010]|nr:hypothetical protein BGX20_011235 [Mortierella sp. AD010]